MLAPDGKVAEQGTYEELSSRPDGAFTKLMEWQINGGENTPANAPISPATEEKLWQLEKEEAEADVEDASSERDQQKK